MEDYKNLYENILKKNSRLKKKVSNLQGEIEKLKEERLSCDIEPLKGELIGRPLLFGRVNDQRYALVEVWATEPRPNGFEGTPEKPEMEKVFLRCDNPRKPIPGWIRVTDLEFVIKQKNNARFILNPKEGQPLHILISGDVFAWEGYDENLVSDLQVEHDKYYLRKCAEDAAMYKFVEEEEDS